MTAAVRPSLESRVRSVGEARASWRVSLMTARERSCMAPGPKFGEGSSHSSKALEAAGHSGSTIENQAVSRFLPL